MQFLHYLAFIGLAIGAGVSLVVQASISAELQGSLGSTAWAAFISYVSGTLTMIIVLLAVREPWPTMVAVARTPWWSWAPGVFGAIYIGIAIVLLPRLGAATVIALVVMGQMLSSMLFDHFGLFGLPKHSADFTRLFGALMLLAGVIVIRR